MAVFTNYCSSGSKANRYALRLTVTLNSQDKVNNTSNISYVLQLAGASYFGLDVDYTGSSFYGYTCNGSITIKNASTGIILATASGSSKEKVSSSSAITIASGSATVPHNSDGSLTLSVSGTFTGGLSSQTTGGSVYGTTILTKIARASSVSATDGDIESTISIYINKTNENYTHTLAYDFYGLTGTIVDRTTEKNIPFPIPSSFYEKIQNAKQGPCTITCTTYSGSTSIGTSTYSFQVKTNEEKCKPTISNISIVDTLTTATGDPNILVRHISIPNIIATLTSKNSSSIKSYRVTCGDGQTISAESSYSSLNVTFQKEITNNIFSVSVTDSRGYTTTEEIITSWIEYIPLTINPSFSRVTPTDGKVKLIYEGKCFNGKVGDKDNVLTIRYRYKINTDSEYSEWGTIAPTMNGNTYQGTTTLSENYTYTEAYDFEIKVLDLLNTNGISETRSITRGIPVYWWNKTSFNIETSLNINKKSILDLTYPVGSIYMSINSTEPSNLFGGSWEQIKGRFLLGTGIPDANTDNYFGDMSGWSWNAGVGTTGGQDYHRLTTDEIPPHGHSGLFYAGNDKAISMNTGGNGYSIKWETNGSGIYNEIYTGYTGNGAVHNNMPPYFSVYIWKRIS